MKQWFEKNDSYFLCSGTFFFCSTPDKARVIHTMVKNGLMKASEIKKDEVFLIKDEDQTQFFDTLAKVNVSYYSKKPKEFVVKKKEKVLDVSGYFGK
jgi:hypothetical protein